IRQQLDLLTSDWGVEVPNVEIRDVIISEQLEDAIAREPAAEREKRARLKLAEAELMAAKTIFEAARVYEEDPVALQLRSMNMLYEMCMEGRSTVIFVPTETKTGMPAPVGVFGLVDRLERREPSAKEKADG
ncbi:MAG: slipin family protein, partial [Firmicutes bacterium]|nr:slipin family protein [Bacillota bacterium]